MVLLTRQSVSSINDTSPWAEHEDGLTIIGLSAATQEGIFIASDQMKWNYLKKLI